MIFEPWSCFKFSCLKRQKLTSKFMVTLYLTSCSRNKTIEEKSESKFFSTPNRLLVLSNNLSSKVVSGVLLGPVTFVLIFAHASEIIVCIFSLNLIVSAKANFEKVNKKNIEKTI